MIPANLPSANIIRVPAQGFSMEPFILDGDELLVRQTGFDFKPGDIVLFRSSHGVQPIAHRLKTVDFHQKQLIFRSDANPALQECVGFDAVLGKVEYVRRNQKILKIQRNVFLSFAVLFFFPLILKIKNKAVYICLPILSQIQRFNFYRKIVSRHWIPKISKVSSSTAHRFVATVAMRFAGSVDLESKQIEGNTVFWVSSLSVRVRYRGAGIAKKLMQEVERFAAQERISELWLSYDERNRAAMNLYRELGYEWVVGEKKLSCCEIVMKKRIPELPNP